MDFDRYGQAIRAEYAIYTSGLMARYLAASAAGRALDAVGEFRSAGLAALSTLLGRAIALTNDYTAPLGMAGMRDARDNPFVDELRKVALKNLNDLIVRLMGGALRPADLFNRASGAAGLLLQRRLETPRLLVRDRAGRAWQADAYVATAARDFAYQAYIDWQIAQAEARGTVLARVAYPYPDHEHHGLEVRVDQLGRGSELRTEIFHPNSHALLAPYTDVPT